MIIIDEKLLDEFRTNGRCEWCGFYCQRREAAHIFARGMGGGGRLDIRINLVGLGGPGECDCHGSSHRGDAPTQIDLLAIVAQREGRLQDDIEDEIHLLRRSPNLAGEIKPRKFRKPRRTFG